MKIIRLLFLVCFSFLVARAASAQNSAKEVVPAENVIKSIQALLRYNSEYLKFKEEFTAYDEHMHHLGNEVFLKKITSGNYLPLRLASSTATAAYRLYKLPSNTDPDVKIMLKQIGETNYGYALIQGKKFPPFRFQDLSGKVYTSANTKGKIIVLKAWFTSCVPCIAEMPLLNRVKENYHDRKDIIFLSIAFDSKKALQKFAARKIFNYAIIPVTAKFIEEDLHATGYPVHWVINKQGYVVDMSYNHEEMIAALQKEASK
jgi:thiol-disulfide isomerase/thioredoxin